MKCVNFWVKIIIGSFGHWVLSSKSQSAQNSVFSVFLQCIMVQLSAAFGEREIRRAGYLSSMRVLNLDLGA